MVGTQTSVSVELAELFAMSCHWTTASGGLYNPLVGRLTEKWSHAAASGLCPSRSEALELAREISGTPFTVVGTEIAVHKDCSQINLNALAKGHSIDRVFTLLWQQFPCDRLVINVGGDLRARCRDTADEIRVGIEHPTIIHGNQPPQTAVALRDGGLATSGSSHRGLTVGTQTFSHLIDPRTGWPIDPDEVAASVTVVADSAAQADVMATVGALVPFDEAVTLVERSARSAGITSAVAVGAAVVRDTNQVAWSTNERFRQLTA